MGLLDVAAIFRDEARKMSDARERCIRIHCTDDIRAAGNEVEMPVREFFARMLPKRFYVTHGHILDKTGKVSPQLDIIISDNTAVASLLTTADGTHYVPAEAVYAIGEIKSSYYKAKKYIQSFSDTLRFIREQMVRPLVENTAYGGLNPHTDLAHVWLKRPNRYFNPLFSFALFVNHGDASKEHLQEVFLSQHRADLPAVTGLLDHGVVRFGMIDGERYLSDNYPAFSESPKLGWIWAECPWTENGGTAEGNHLASVYHSLLQHLNQSYLEPPDLKQYFEGFIKARRSTLVQFGQEDRGTRRFTRPHDESGGAVALNV
jgi:hypothetical protein